MRKNFTISVDEDILTRFKEFCDANDINMSKRLERHMKEIVEKTLAEVSQQNGNSHQNGNGSNKGERNE